MKLKEVMINHMITHLLRLCKQEFGLSSIPKINLVNQSTVGGGSSFGEFTGNEISVVIKDRHPVDVMRTLAHEIVHWKQHESGQDLDGSDGSETENEANALAGVILRKFGKMYPEYFTQSIP